MIVSTMCLGSASAENSTPDTPVTSGESLLESGTGISMQRDRPEAALSSLQKDLANERYGRALGKTERVMDK